MGRGRKNKNIIGGAASGATAGMGAGLWGALAGAAVGGVLGSQQESDAQQLAPAIPQDVVDRLYRQSTGQEQTIGELKGAQMYDKTLAQQIAAAKAQRGVNPALLSRNVARIAAEQSQANAQNAAILAAEERNQALAKYMQAQQLNSNIQAQNLGFERTADAQANNMMGVGLNSLAGSLVNQTKKDDAIAQLEAQNQKAATASNSVKDPINTSNLSLGSTEKAQQVNSAYSLGANTDLSAYSDKNLKTNTQSMKVTSDERQKDLIKSESLPVNNNLSMQNQQAVQPQPQAQPVPVAQPAQATPQASQPQTQAAPPVAKAGITAEMLQQAQRSSKRGGNVSDIQNASNQLTRAAEGPSQQEILDMTADAQRRQTRDVFGNVTQSDAENYAANLARWQAAAQAQNAAFDKNQANVDAQNLINDATRTARLNRFYTGIDTASTGTVASQYAPKVVTPQSDWYSAQAAQRAAGIGDQSSSGGWSNIQGHLNQFARSPYAQVLAPGSAAQASSIAQLSDETKKTAKTKESSKSGDFNPKSFLDKLEAYSYEYKDSAKGLPGVTDGRQLSVMAQDLEKAGPVGKNMVEQDEQGNKVVDYGKGFGAILASQAHLNERLSQIEKMYSKKKKES